MPISFRAGGDGPGALPRQGPEPEPNIIQNPEMMRGLQQALGLRQAHVAPTMNPELQPVIIVANTTTSVRAVPVRYAVFAELILSLGGEPLFSLWNPPSSGVLARIRKYAYTFDDAQDILNFCLAPQDVVLPPGPGKRGQRMFTSRVPVTPLSEKQNASFVSLATAEGASLGIGRFDEIMLPSAFPPGPLAKGRLERDFDIVLGPGASFSTFEHNVPLGARREAYYEWEEEPLT